MSRPTFRRLLVTLLTAALTLIVCAQNPFDLNVEAWRMMERQQPDSAIATQQRVVKLFEQQHGKDHPQVGVALNDLAEMLSHAGRPKDAIPYITRSMKIEADAFGDDSNDYIERAALLARLYNEAHDNTRAVEWGERVLAAREEGSPFHTRELGAALSNLTWYYADANDYAHAISLCRRALEVWTEELGEGHPYIAILNNNLANYHAILGDFQEAVRYDQQCMDVVMRYTDTPDTLYAAALSNKAQHLGAAGLNTLALEAGIEAVKLRKQLQGEHHPKYLKAVSDLAATYARLHEIDEAIRIEQHLLTKREEAGLTRDLSYVRSLGNMALLQATNGHLDEAITQTETALRLARELNLDSEVPMLTSNLSLYYGQQKRYEDAIQTGEETLRYIKKHDGTDNVYYARQLGDMSVWYHNSGKNRRAIDYAQRAIDIHHKVFGDDSNWDMNSRQNLAQFYADEHSWNDALNTLAPAADKATRAMLRNFTGLSAQQRNHYWGKYRGYITNLLPRYTLRSGRSDMAGQLYDQSALFAKSLLLNTELEMTRLIFESGDQGLVDQYYEIQTLKTDLDKLRSLPRAQRTADADSLQLDISRREALLARASKTYGDYCARLNVHWQQVRDQLREGDLAVEFLAFTEDTTLTYAALTLKHDYEQPRLTEICTDADLTNLGAATYNVNPRERNIDLCHRVWSPLQKEMEGVRRIYFSPAGRLYQIGIEQLPWDSLTIVADHYDLYRLSSTRELCQQHDSTDVPAAALLHRAVLYGGLAYDIILDDDVSTKNKVESTNQDQERSANQEETLDRGIVKKLNKHLFSYLKNTQVEVDAIGEELTSHDIDCTMLTNEEGTEQTFKQLSGKGYNLLHVATHGQYVPFDKAEQTRQNLNMQFLQTSNDESIALTEDVSLSRSLLAMAGANTLLSRLSSSDNMVRSLGDGVLTAGEISRTDLRGMDLVVLSACQTGLGDVTSEGVMGLQRGFKKAGAQTILMSLWSVDDRATAQLMVSFYRHLMQGESKRQSFLAAQQELREKYATTRNAERLWGAFILLDALD